MNASMIGMSTTFSKWGLGNILVHLLISFAEYILVVTDVSFNDI